MIGPGNQDRRLSSLLRTVNVQRGGQSSQSPARRDAVGWCRVGWQPDDWSWARGDEGRCPRYRRPHAGRRAQGCGPVTALIWFAAGFAVALFLRARVSNRTGTEESDSPPPRTRARTSTGTGRAVLRTMRTVNDVRAISRGPGAYGRRLLRRQAFRSLRKW